VRTLDREAPGACYAGVTACSTGEPERAQVAARSGRSMGAHAFSPKAWVPMDF